MEGGAAATGMQGIISQLTAGITSASLFAQVGEVMPFVIQIIPFCVGYYILRKVVKGTSKLKVRF